MIEQTGVSTSEAVHNKNVDAGPKRILRMVKNERMGGFVPSWETVSTAQQKIEENLNLAKNGKSQASFKATLAYQDTGAASQEEEFGFGDLVDMINPLHHIPIVSHLYRNITGDEIKPIGKIIGGAIFGGVAGAASSLVNVVIEEETGRDLAGNALAFAFNKNRTGSQYIPDHPESKLNNAVKTARYNDLPVALLAFTDLGYNSDIKTEKTGLASGRTAGTIARKIYPVEAAYNLSPHEPITQISMKRMPYYRD